MKRNLVIAGIFVSFFGVLLQFERTVVVEADAVQAPRFEVDPLWPKPLPNHWVIGSTVGVSVDSHDRIWIVHRANNDPGELRSSTNPPQATCCNRAPCVMEFDQAGNLLRHWGGPGEGYDWPIEMHGITVDYEGNVWLGAAGNELMPGTARGSSAAAQVPHEVGRSDLTVGVHDEMILKFTGDGKFLMQMGKPAQSKGSDDVENLRRPAKTFVDPKPMNCTSRTVTAIIA
jgi:hypothetical protein